METKSITLQEATEAVKGLFDVSTYGNRQEGKSYFIENSDGTTFYFDKRQYWRDEVIGKLSEYFNGKRIEGGQCRIDGITLLWTTVHLEKLPEEKEKKSPVPFTDVWEKHRDLVVVMGNGEAVKLRDLSDDDLKGILKGKVSVKAEDSNVHPLTVIRVVRGEIMYRINKKVYNPSF